MWLIHPLKFYTQPNQSQPSKRPVVNENYDEIIFVNPKPEIQELLLKEDNNGTFQEPLNIKKNSDNDEDVKNILMEVEEEDKSLATNSQLNQNLNLTTSISHNSDKGLTISNVSQYFTKFDDSAIINELTDKNNFMISEIEKLKQELKKKEEDIINLNKEIRKYK